MESEQAIRTLEELLDRVDKQGLKKLLPEEVGTLGRLYRRAAAILSRTRTRGKEGADVDRLNRLVARGYSLIYTTPGRRGFSLRQLLIVDFPGAFRRHWQFFAAAVLISLAGCVLGSILTAADPQMPDVLLGPGWSSESQRVADRHTGVKNWLPDPERPMASAMIITNNIRVSFLAFSTGILLGLGTLYVMWYNGLMLGAIGAVVADNHVALSFWSFVAPHGVLELTAIFISGAAGLLLGYALVNPGPYTRADALRLAGREAAPLIAGVVVMLMMAGVIEAFFSPVPEIPPAFKLSFAGVLAFCLCTFLLRSGKGER